MSKNHTDHVELQRIRRILGTKIINMDQLEKLIHIQPIPGFCQLIIRSSPDLARELSLLLLGLGHLGCLVLHLTGARQTAVHLAHVGRKF